MDGSNQSSSESAEQYAVISMPEQGPGPGQGDDYGCVEAPEEKAVDSMLARSNRQTKVTRPHPRAKNGTMAAGKAHPNDPIKTPGVYVELDIIHIKVHQPEINDV